MKPKKEKKAACSLKKTASQKTIQQGVYHTKRQIAIAKRRAAIVESNHATYDKAVSGTSLRAAITSFCHECLVDTVDEIRKCTDLACPLYAVRPYKHIPQSTHNKCFDDVKSTSDRRGEL